jgi:hypothetical protein
MQPPRGTEPEHAGLPPPSPHAILFCEGFPRAVLVSVTFQAILGVACLAQDPYAVLDRASYRGLFHVDPTGAITSITPAVPWQHAHSMARDGNGVTRRGPVDERAAYCLWVVSFQGVGDGHPRRSGLGSQQARDIVEARDQTAWLGSKQNVPAEASGPQE